MAKKKKFNPEGSGYGLKKDETGHWPSRCPHTGQLLKGRKHETWDLLEAGEKEAGMEIFKGPDGKYHSKPIKEIL